MAGKLFVVSGPSGAGKGTLLARVLPLVGNIHLAVSATTRQPRKGEKDGVQYHFLSEEGFDELIKAGGLLEWASVHAARYGTPKPEVFEALAAGQDVVLEIDTQGAMQVKASYPQARMVFIEPPSIEELRHRLTDRGTEDAPTIERRLEAVAAELQTRGDYDKVILNDDLDIAADELLAYMQAEREKD